MAIEKYIQQETKKFKGQRYGNRLALCHGLSPAGS